MCHAGLDPASPSVYETPGQARGDTFENSVTVVIKAVTPHLSACHAGLACPVLDTGIRHLTEYRFF